MFYFSVGRKNYCQRNCALDTGAAGRIGIIRSRFSRNFQRRFIVGSAAVARNDLTDRIIFFLFEVVAKC